MCVYIGIVLVFLLLYFFNHYRVRKVDEYTHKIQPMETSEDKKRNLPPLNTIHTKKYYQIIRKIRKKKGNNHLFVAVGEKIVDLKEIGSLLVVGPTGSGKSILMDDIICSILMNYKSSVVKLALIDTNHVEFNNYKDLDYLLKDEIDRNLIKRIDYEVSIRKKLFEESGVETIDAYNKINKKKKMSYIILIIDDLYDFKDISFHNILHSNVGVFLIFVSDFSEYSLDINTVAFEGIGCFSYQEKKYNSIELTDLDIENITAYHRKI